MAQFATKILLLGKSFGIHNGNLVFRIPQLKWIIKDSMAGLWSKVTFKET